MLLAVDRRRHFYQFLSSWYQPFYKALCLELDPCWQPYSGERDFATQDGLYARGRTVGQIGPQFRVTNAKGGQSAHNYGCGSDWTWFDGDTLVWLQKEDDRWHQYIAAIRKVGLKAGADFGDIDHNELALSCDWPHVLLAYQQGGMTAAQEHIGSNRLSIIPLTQNP